MLKTKSCLATGGAVAQHLGLDWRKGAYMPFHTTRANEHLKGQRSGGGQSAWASPVCFFNCTWFYLHYILLCSTVSTGLTAGTRASLKYHSVYLWLRPFSTLLSPHLSVSLLTCRASPATTCCFPAVHAHTPAKLVTQRSRLS